MQGQAGVAVSRAQNKGTTLVVLVAVVSVLALLVHAAVWTSVARTALAPRPASYQSASGGSGGVDSGGSGGSGNTSPALHLDHSCLRHDNPPTTAKVPVGDPYGPISDELGDKAELQRLYAVSGTTLTPKDGAGPVRSCDEQLWDIVVATLPPDLRPALDEFLVFDTDLSSRDGYVVGEVSPRGEDPAHWRLSVAPNSGSDLDVAITVAHEVGHLMTLTSAQLKPGVTDATCDTTSVPEGCLADDSLLQAFTDGTWDESQWSAWEKADAIDDDNKRQDAIDAFYDSHAKDFVTSYAATDPMEDFAETFAVWCAVGPDSPVLSDVVEGDVHDGAAKLAWMSHPSQALPAGTAKRCDALRALTK